MSGFSFGAGGSSSFAFGSTTSSGATPGSTSFSFGTATTASTGTTPSTGLAVGPNAIKPNTNTTFGMPLTTGVGSGAASITTAGGPAGFGMTPTGGAAGINLGAGGGSKVTSTTTASVAFSMGSAISTAGASLGFSVTGTTATAGVSMGFSMSTTAGGSTPFALGGPTTSAGSTPFALGGATTSRTAGFSSGGIAAALGSGTAGTTGISAQTGMLGGAANTTAATPAGLGLAQGITAVKPTPKTFGGLGTPATIAFKSGVVSTAGSTIPSQGGTSFLGTPKTSATPSPGLISSTSTTKPTSSGATRLAMPAVTSTTTAGNKLVSTVPTTTTSAPGLTTSGFPSTISASLGTTTTTTSALAAPTMDYRQLEESINKWTLELEEQEKVFLQQATQVNGWDNLLIENGEKITQLNMNVEKVKEDQQRLEQELDFILCQQRELEELLTPLEHAVEQLPPIHYQHHADVEREITYKLSENIDAQLKRMVQDLKEIIEHLNASSNGQDSTDPMSQIAKILNAHMDSLQWVDQNTTLLQRKVDEVAKQVEVRRKEQERNFRLAYD